mgnify:CR=1 FL=1
MNYTIKKADIASLKTHCLVVPVFSTTRLTDTLTELDKVTQGSIKSLLKSGDIESNKTGGSILAYNLPNLAANRLLLLACGKESDFNSHILNTIVLDAVKKIDASGATDAGFILPDFIDSSNAYDLVRTLVVTAENATYQFNQCKSDPKTNKKPLKKITVLYQDGKLKSSYSKAVEHGQAIAVGQGLTKDLANLPGNICTPTYLADQAKDLKRGVRKLKLNILEEKDMEALGMGALLSVSKGSRQPAKLIVMEYKGAPAKTKPVVLVGKGLTFDAGGISIKPSGGMDEMKYDMCGGATVFGVMKACVELDLPINVIGVVPSSENLPDGAANKPGDIVTSMSGQTIEILNTDAEGRLILCDALTYCERFEPAAVIDMATLTGACIVALGRQASGLLSNNDQLSEDLISAGQETYDRVWRLPLWDEYQKQLDSNFADMANIGGPDGGTITAACFLARFTKKYKWAHLDIAGTAWNTGANKGATGRPVSLIMQYLLKKSKQI